MTWFVLCITLLVWIYLSDERGGFHHDDCCGRIEAMIVICVLSAIGCVVLGGTTTFMVKWHYVPRNKQQLAALHDSGGSYYLSYRSNSLNAGYLYYVTQPDGGLTSSYVTDSDHLVIYEDRQSDAYLITADSETVTPWVSWFVLPKFWDWRYEFHLPKAALRTRTTS